MIVIRDEQIVSAIYTVTGWSSFTISFLSSLYASTFVNALSSAGIFWHNVTDKNRLEHLASTYPSYFSFDERILKCLKSQEDHYNAFLASIPEEIQKVLAGVIGSTFRATR